MRSVRELRILGEALAAIVVTWLLLGWFFVDRTITQADGSVLVVPFVQSALAGSADWADHLYRVGVLGGSKMHEFGGTLPLVQLCNLLGLSTTATVNLLTVFVQLCFAFFGVVALQGLVTAWSPDRKLTWTERVIGVWCFAFMPLFAWRFAVGHENLLQGLLPLWIGVALLFAARSKQLGVTSLVFAAFAVANAVSGLGPQTIAYSVVFGAPLVVLAIVDAPRGSRWTRQHWIALAALACGVLVVLPRMAPMLAHATSDDASRSLGVSVKESFGTTAWRDWLGSIPWTQRIVESWQARESLHEHNFALGPLLVLLPLAWARGRRLVIGVVLGAVLAILFAQGVEPVASALSFLDAFRVPARAIFPAAMFIPLLALAGWFARTPVTDRPRAHLLALLGGCAAIVVLPHAPALVVEILAWLGCIGLVAIARLSPTNVSRLAPALAVVAALGVVSFSSRFPRHVPWDTVEHGPRALRQAALEQAPELADPINRVILNRTLPPFAMSTAWAAQLGSLDGVWYPPKRFMDLLSTLSGSPVPPTTCVFALGTSHIFPVLQQLYNVRYALSVADQSFQELPAPLGPAWFVSELSVIESPRAMAMALASGGDFRPKLAATGWVLAPDATPRAVAPACASARVVSARSDGQSIELDVSSPADCVVVVSTNYVTTLRASATVGATTSDTAVFPIDIALTGVAVPRDTTRIRLGPAVSVPIWARIAQLLGVLALAGALVAYRRS